MRIIDSNMSVFRKKIFSDAIGDEVLLAKQARLLLEKYTNPIQYDDLLRVSSQHGIDMASRCYYESLLKSEHGVFKAFIDQHENEGTINTENRRHHGIKILIVPGMFYKEHPEVGADGRLVVSIAKQCGFDVEVIPIESKGSISTNVDIINHKVHQETASMIWFVSLSKGSSEVRHYLQSCHVSSAVKGWLNIAGINNGSPHAYRKLSTPLRRIAYTVISKLMNVDYQVLRELNPKHEMWAMRQWDKRIDLIHVVPIPLRSHLQPMLRRRYEKLVEYGPNDGIVPVLDVGSMPGKIYPVWGVDHFMRTPHIGELLYKFFSYISQN